MQKLINSYPKFVNKSKQNLEHDIKSTYKTFKIVNAFQNTLSNYLHKDTIISCVCTPWNYQPHKLWDQWL